MSRATLVNTVLSLQAFAGLAAFAPAADDVQETGVQQVAAEQPSGVELIEDARITPTVRAVRRARTSTVNIHSEKSAPVTGDAIFQSGRDRKVNGMGTGIVVDERGYIVTNHHVVADVDSLRVVLFDGSSYTARVVSFDRRKDLAIIKIQPARTLETMPLGTSSDLMLGEDVIAIGNSFGYEHTITRGIISALSRNVEVNAEQDYKNLIQTDTAINPGNSGGPLINRNGDVIGINVAIRAGAQKIGFAIPIDDARKVIARLMSVEQLDKKYHGATLEDRKNGPVRELIVANVTTGSPADLAGIKSGDVIETVAGRPTVDSADFERMLLGRGLAGKIPVQVKRDGESVDVKLGLTRLDSGRALTAYKSIDTLATQPVSTSSKPNGSAWDVFGLELKPVGASATARTKYRGGMRVTSVRPSGPASREHIRAGDILVGLDKYEVVNTGHIDYVLTKARRGASSKLKFYILRNGETLFGYFNLGTTL